MRPSYSADTLTCATPDCPGVVFLFAKKYFTKSFAINQKRFTFGVSFIQTTPKLNVMNIYRRKQINRLIERLREIQEEVNEIQEQEQEYFDNMPESLQDGEKGEKADAAINNLQEASDNIESALESLEAAAE